MISEATADDDVEMESVETEVQDDTQDEGAVDNDVEMSDEAMSMREKVCLLPLHFYMCCTIFGLYDFFSVVWYDDLTLIIFSSLLLLQLVLKQRVKKVMMNRMTIQMTNPLATKAYQNTSCYVNVTSRGIKGV